MNPQGIVHAPLRRAAGTPAEPRPWYLVGMTGPTGAGKDSAAAALVARGYRAIAFVDALRHQVATAWGVSENLLTAPATKHQPLYALAIARCNDRFFRSWAFLQGLPGSAAQSPRAVLRAWADFIRSADPALLVRIVDRWIMEQLQRGHRHLVVTDVSLPAEWRLIKHRDGVIVRVKRPDLRSAEREEGAQAHLLTFDAAIVNDGSLGRLQSQVIDAVCGVLSPAAAGPGACPAPRRGATCRSTYIDHSEEVTLQASKPEDRQRQLRKPRKATARGRILPTDTRPGHEQVVAQPAHVPAPVSIAARHPTGEVIVPADVKRTVAPVRPGRFEVAGPVIGGFATMRPGQYLPEAGFSNYLDEQP